MKIRVGVYHCSMSWTPIFDINAVMKRLRPVIELTRPRTPADFAAALPEFATLPCYQDLDGSDRLLRDLTDAIADLPFDSEVKVQDSVWARLILGLDQPDETITERRVDLLEGNGSARKYRDRYVIQSVLHRLQLTALDAPPSVSPYDCGFALLGISVSLLARVRHPLNVHHRVELQLRAARGGQRIVPFCYKGATPFSSVAVLTAPSGESPTAEYIGSSNIAITGNRQFPMHFFWLSQSPVPGASLTLRLVFDEVYTRPWNVIPSCVRLTPGDSPTLRFEAGPRRSFRHVCGYRIAQESSEPIQEFRARSGTKNLPNLAPYLAEARGGDEALELRCYASDRCVDNQRRIIGK
jgi:hypothetical protein